MPLEDPERADLFLAYAVDLGGVEELTAGQRVALRRLVEADRIARTCHSWLLSTHEKPGSERVARVISAMLSAGTATFRALSLLGLQRRTKYVDPHEALRRAIDAVPDDPADFEPEPEPTS